jgi:[protein-PII] uridylyltransferase
VPTYFEKLESSAAERLTLPPGRLPSQELQRIKDYLKVETHRLKILHRAGASGRDVCRGRSRMLDLLICHVLESLLANAPEFQKTPPPTVAMVATGGYGRAELNPFSDIDIMFLHEKDMVVAGRANAKLEALVNGVLYTLWDVGLKVGQAVRSVEDCVRVAEGDMQSKTSLIEARLITGDKALFEKLQKAVISKCVEGSENDYIQARLADQATRREKFGNSACMQEPNIKNGCGGLRDYQNLIWMTFFKYQTRSLAELQEKEMITESERKRLDVAYDFLLRSRNELHYNVNRAVDVMAKSSQASIAHYMGYTDRSPSRRVEQFMGDFYTHTRNIYLITRTLEQRLALAPKTALMSSFANLLRSGTRKIRQQEVDGFKVLDGEIHPLSKNVFRDSPRRLMRVFLYAQQRNLKLHPDVAQIIRNQLSLVNNEFLRDPHVRETFLEILDQRGNVAPVLRSMHEVGFLGKFIPEFGKLTCLVQHEFYHQYTADEHTLFCIEKLDQVWNAQKPPYSAYTDLFRQVERPFVLYLALLLHDSGKAYHTGKHEDIGARNALRAAGRLGLDGAKTHALRLIIESHLAMVQISQRRDLDDESVIRSFAQQVQSIENLGMLTLHTFADSMGTSETLWNGFKEAALWALYRKTYQALSGGPEFHVAETRERELLVDEIHHLKPNTFSNEEIVAHFSTLPPRYFQINDAREILRDISQVHRFFHVQVSDKEDNALVPIFSWHNEPDRGYTSVHICTWDRERLFSSMTGCLTAAGMNILGAEILTRSDGVVLDNFFVSDARTGLMATREEREKFEALLGKILTGATVDLPLLISRQKRAPAIYKSIEGERIPVSVRLGSETSENRMIIDIEAEDRVGLLYDICQTLTELSLDVSLAKILTEKGAAIDTFYVTEHSGITQIEPEERVRIETALREAIIRGQNQVAPVASKVTTRPTTGGAV